VRLRAPRRAHRIDSHDARSFWAGTLRARLLRLVFAAAAVALLAASLASARDLDTRERGLLPKGTTGVVVLDLSLSIADEDYAAVRAALRRIADDDVRIGLVVFSDVAYELLPPGSPSSELRPLFRFLQLPKEEFTAPPVNPWTTGFRAGTRISSALELAQDMLVRDGIQNPSILLVSDLETAPEDVPLLARTVDGLRRSNIEFEVAALGPSSDAQTLFSEFLADSPFALPSEGEEEATGSTSESTYGTPNALLLLGALLFAALALHERFGARLALPLVPRQTRESG
jgi:von Willebrand factor type A domain